MRRKGPGRVPAMLHVAAALLVLTLFPRPTSTFSPALRFPDLSSSRRLSHAVQSRTWDVTTCRLQPSVNSVSAPIDRPVAVAADELLVPVVTPVTAENADATHGSLPKSFFLLNAVAIVWGSQHVVIKSSLETLPPSALNLGRFATSSVLFLPALAAVLTNGNTKTLRAGAELGLWTALGFAFQSVGLLTTTASHSAFLLYLNVKIVPFLAWALLGRKVAASTWASALLAIAGTALLSTDGGPPTEGDVWSVAAATASAMFILRLEGFARAHDAAQLNGVAFATVTALCALWFGADLLLLGHDSPAAARLLPADMLGTFLANPWPILYLGAFSTGLCNFLQTLGQRDIAAERAAIIYSMDPVYGAAFSYLFLHEGLGSQGIVGAALVLLGVALSAATTNMTTTTTTTAAAPSLPSLLTLPSQLKVSDNDQTPP